MAAIMAWKPGASVADTVAAAVARGDSAGAEQALRTAQGTTANRYRSLEAEINALA